MLEAVTNNVPLGYGREYTPLAPPGTEGFYNPTLSPITPQVASEGPGFVICGSGRSGTTYISHVLQKVHIRCGHEEWFTPFLHRRVVGIDGDSSWMATPVLEYYPGKIFAQARHPLKVIGSLAAYDHGRFMRGEIEDAVFWVLKTNALPILKLRKDAIYNSTLWYIAIYEKALKHADMWWRVEDLDAETLKELTIRIGRPADIRECRFAIENTGKEVHKHHQGALTLTWDDVPDELYERLHALSVKLGYV